MIALAMEPVIPKLANALVNKISKELLAMSATMVLLSTLSPELSSDSNFIFFFFFFFYKAI